MNQENCVIQLLEFFSSKYLITFIIFYLSVYQPYFNRDKGFILFYLLTRLYPASKRALGMPLLFVKLFAKFRNSNVTSVTGPIMLSTY